MKMAEWREKAACPDRQEGVPESGPSQGPLLAFPPAPLPTWAWPGGGVQGALGCSGNELQDPISPAISKCKPPFHSTGLHCLPLQDSPRADGQMWILHLAEEEAAQAGMGAGLPGTPPWGGGFLDHPVLCSYPTRQHPVPLHPRPSSPASWTTTSTPVGRSGPRPSSSNVPSFVSATRAPSAPRCDSDGWCPAQKPWPTAAPFPASVSLGA